MEDKKKSDLIEELKKFDNPEGYKQEYQKVKKDLEPVIKQLINKKEEAIDSLHALLEEGETWSCLFALEILMEIGSEKSIYALINYILRNEKEEFGDICECAMKGLQNIGEPAIEPLIKEVKKQFSQKKFFIFLVGALTGIKSEKVYNFMKEIVKDYIENEEKYDEWFYIEIFMYDFDVQGKKEILPLLRKILDLERTSKYEEREIKDTIEKIEDPEAYNQKMEEEKEKLKPLIDEFLNNEKTEKESDNEPLSKEIKEKMFTSDYDLKIQFKCHDCNKKQNINPGLIKNIGDENPEFSFENEILCKFCFSNNLKPTKDGEREILCQGIGTIEGTKQGVVPINNEVYVENKEIPFRESYDYIKKRIKEEPNKGELYLRAGNIAKKFNKYKEAIKHYKKAIELNPKLIAVYMNLVGIYDFRYRYYGIQDAKNTGSLYLNKMADIFRSQDYDNTTIVNQETIVHFMGEKSESLEVNIPELIKVDTEYKRPKKKIGRNDPCPCGSGKKYKKCCLKV